MKKGEWIMNYRPNGHVMPKSDLGALTPESSWVIIVMLILISVTDFINSVWETHQKAHKHVRRIIRK